MLTINNLNITTLKGRNLVSDFSFSLNDNDKIALIGEEGNGKSTILKIIAGIDVSDYVNYTGSILCNTTIGYLPQKIEDDWLDKTAEQYICRKKTNDKDDHSIYEKYSELYDSFIMVNLDISILENERIISTLSGGEKVKLQLAKLLFSDAGVLLLDEPTNDLDLKTLMFLEEFISNCNKPVIFISHDETLLENCANGILHLEQLKRKSEPKLTFERLGYKEYCEVRLHRIKRVNEIAKKEKQEFNKQLEKYRRIYQKVEYQQNTISRGDPHGAAVLKKKMANLKSQNRKLDDKEKNLTERFDPEEAINIFFDDIKLDPNKVILDFNLDKLQIEDKVLAENISLHVLAKEKICIIGDNGSGKSTLIKLLYKDLLNKAELKVGYMPQNYYDMMDYNKTPVEYLMQGHIDSERGKIQSYLGSLRFTEEEMTHKIEGLSEGQKGKIMIVSLIISGCDVIVLDEPTRNLSPLSNPRIREILSDYGGCIISISHDRKFIQEVCTTVYLLEDNKLTKME